MRGLLFALLTLISFGSQANVIFKTGKIDNLAYTIRSEDGKTTYYHEEYGSIPIVPSKLNLPEITEASVVIRLYNREVPEEFGSVRVQAEYLPTFMLFFTGDEVKHFVSTPVNSGGTIYLRDPITMEIIYEHYQKVSKVDFSTAEWHLPPYLLENHEGDFVLIDIAGGRHLYFDGVNPPVQTEQGNETHLYAMVRKEALYEGSITVSMFTHIAYLSMQKNKRRLSSAKYFYFLEENGKRLVATGFDYSYSSPEKALYLRDFGVHVSEYFLRTEFLETKIPTDGEFKVLESFGLLSEEGFSKEVLEESFQPLMHGWGWNIKGAKSRFLTITTLSPIKEGMPVKVNGDLATPKEVKVGDDGGVINEYPTSIVDSDEIKIEITPPLGTTLIWFGCDEPPGGSCTMNKLESYNIVVKAAY